jgi:hypothetical protein
MAVVAVDRALPIGDAKGADEERPPQRRQALDEGDPLTPFGGTATSCFNGRGRPSARPRP